MSKSPRRSTQHFRAHIPASRAQSTGISDTKLLPRRHCELPTKNTHYGVELSTTVPAQKMDDLRIFSVDMLIAYADIRSSVDLMKHD